VDTRVVVESFGVGYGLRGAGVADGNLLEVGCGDGFVVTSLVELLQLKGAVGVDPFLQDDQLVWLNEKTPKVEFVRETSGDCRFEVATLLDVLEHVEDDRALLKSAVDQLVPEGTIMITVPAHPCLFSSHDTFMSHYRRYSKKALYGLLDDCGLETIHSGSLFGGLLAVRSLQKLGEAIMGEPKESVGLAGWRGGQGSASFVSSVLSAEGASMIALAKLGIRLPGLSLWALARQRQCAGGSS
jgi:hypothetical protein